MNTFSFNADTYDYWLVFQAIQRFYPLGLAITTDNIGLYMDYPGIKALEKKVVAEFHGDKYDVWLQPTQAWQSALDAQFLCTTNGQAPGFSGYFELEKHHTEDRIRVKQLHFAVSTLGPFFTLFGQEIEGVPRRTVVKDRKGAPLYLAGGAQTGQAVVSPWGEYEPPFLQLEDLVRTQFPEFRFVPYAMYSQVIEGLHVRYRDDWVNTVYHGLFNEVFDFEAFTVVGDADYGQQEWSKVRKK
ncbi:MAG TPA: hypothetical protein DCE41_01005 [Cytophagales bacterium]|nr:hypothetical protein [Cytophagales bacterium]